MLLRSSVDFSLDDQGNTAVSLDVLNFNVFINDYAAFVIGKSDSSLGSFVPNISPAWINRLPDAPVGFNDNQAAPQSEIGARLQGGFQITENMSLNYIAFVANGPQAQVDTTNNVIDSIATDAFPNNNGTFIYGGRIGFLPIPKFEIGVSAAAGKLSLMDMSDDSTLQAGRNYHVIGADAAYKPGNWDLRMEYIQQQIGSQSGSIVPQAQRWKAWYAQVAYWIPETKFEPVVRYGRFLAPKDVSIQDQRQWAFGLDYWFTPSFAAQAEYELNEAPANSGNNTNFFTFQLVFGY